MSHLPQTLSQRISNPCSQSLIVIDDQWITLFPLQISFPIRYYPPVFVRKVRMRGYDRVRKLVSQVSEIFQSASSGHVCRWFLRQKFLGLFPVSLLLGTCDIRSICLDHFRKHHMPSIELQHCSEECRWPSDMFSGSRPFVFGYPRCF